MALFGQHTTYSIIFEIIIQSFERFSGPPLLVLFGLIISVTGVFICAALPWIVAFSKRDIDVLEPIYFKSAIIAMTGVALYHYAFLREPEWRYPLETDYYAGVLEGAGLRFIYFALILIAYYGTERYYCDQSISLPQPRRSDVTQALKISGTAFMIIGTTAYMVLMVIVASDGGLFRVFASTEPRSQIFAGLYLLVTLTNAMYMGYFAWLLSLFGKGITPKIRHYVPFAAIFGSLILLGSRSLMIRLLLMFVTIHYYVFLQRFLTSTHPISDWFLRRSPLIQLSLLPILGIVAALIIIGSGAARANQSPVDAILSVDPVTLLTPGIHITEIEHFVALREIVQETGYYYGLFYIRTIINLVPSAIWPNKPVQSEGGLIRRTFNPDGTGGAPAGEMQSFYINFGIPGIFVGAIVYGIFLRITYEVLQSNRRSPLILFGYALIFAHLISGGLMNISLAAFIYDFGWFVLLIGVVYLLTRR